MPTVVFTSALSRFLPAPESLVSGRTVRQALDEVFRDNARLRHYILDDRDRLRKHVTIFVDGQAIGHRDALSDPIGENSEIYVMQALSGG